MTESSVEILGVTFLTPALLNLKVNGEERFVQASIDIVNRKVYIDNWETYSEEVFDYLDSVNTLPEDFFMAPDNILEQAVEAQAGYESLRQQHMEE